MRKLYACFAILACAACQQHETKSPAADTTADAQAIEKLEQSQMASIAARQPTAADVYSSDAVFINERGAATHGRDAIAEGFKALLADPSLKLTYTAGSKTFSASGDMAYATADYSLSYMDPVTKKPVTVKGTNLSVWRKQSDGSWKLVADSNPGAPAV